MREILIAEEAPTGAQRGEMVSCSGYKRFWERDGHPEQIPLGAIASTEQAS